MVEFSVSGRSIATPSRENISRRKPVKFKGLGGNPSSLSVRAAPSNPKAPKTDIFAAKA